MSEKLIALLEKQATAIAEIGKDVATVKGEVATVKTSLDERVGKLEGDIKKFGAEYVDDAGRRVGPAFQKGNRGTGESLLITNVIRAMSQKDWSLAKEERQVHEDLVKAGYQPRTIGGHMFPLEPAHIPDEFAPMRESIEKRMNIGPVDFGEVAWLLKRHPIIAKAFDLLEKDLKLGDDTLGGFLVPIVQGDRVIDLLRNRVVVQKMGATEISLPPSGNMTWPKATADPSFSWGDPDRTTDITVTDANFGVLRFQAKQLTGAVAIPNDLIRYSNPSVEVVVRMMMASRAAVVEDAAYFSGLGTTFEPKGLFNYATSATAGTPGFVTLHTPATAPVFSPNDVALMVAKHEESNDPDMPTAWAMRPLMWAQIINKRADAVVADDQKGPFMFPVTRGDAGRAPEKRLLDIPVFTTKQVPISAGAAQIALGNWRRFIIARSGAFEMAASEHVRFLRDQTVIKAILRADAGLEYEESFVVTTAVTV